VAGFDRNRWLTSVGIGGRIASESVAGFDRNPHDDEAGRDPRPTIVAVKGRHLPIDPISIDPGSELHQLVLHVDDLIEPSPTPSPVVLGLFGRIVPSDATTESRFAIRRNPKVKLQAYGPAKPKTLQTQSRAPHRNRFPPNGLDRF
jgi:hypothetical protein